MRTLIRSGAVAAALSLVLAACGGGGTTTTSPAGGGVTTTSPAGGTPSADLTITAPAGAANSGFAETSLTAPAGEAITITFNNDDAGIPHNVQIFEGTSTSGTPVWAPENNELITGVATATYDVGVLEAGTYTYNCLSHPATMVGTLTVV
jgi:plastocyanin